ncbi:MAG: hypothetical protein ACTHLO_10320 [Pseudolabrys sp.]
MRTSTVLTIVGALMLIFGIAVVGFGIPVQEFSFGNTLIMAGATVATGGLIVIALGAVAGQVQRLNEALAQPVMVPQAHAHETFEPMTAGVASEPHPFEPRGPATPPPFPMPAEPAPMLRNPDEPVEVEEDVSLSPPQAAEAQAQTEPSRGLPSWMRSRATPTPAKDERPSIFDSMWPPENKMFGRADAETKTSAADQEEQRPAEPAAEEAPPAEAAHVEPAPVEEEPKPRAVAILKSGVVDGMSYTLYVDGSIEAELPQGTLRFASIHELRAHLEQTS